MFAFSKIIYNPFATSFVYIICQKCLSLNTKFYQFIFRESILAFLYLLAMSNKLSHLSSTLNQAILQASVCVTRSALTSIPVFCIWHTILA